MKILYINSGAPDYLSDMIFHGLRSIHGSNVVDIPKIDYMYSNAHPECEMTSYGKGFTIFRTLEDIDVDRTDIFKKIRDRYFDLIIWSSIHRNKSYFYAATESKNNCISLDGEDHTNLDLDMVWRFNYYKRELDKYHPNLKPISFCYPEEKINNIYNKIKTNATVIPGKLETYIFNNEKDYYKDYNESLFAFTCKKGGWDCLRHYEIIFNNCIPWFLDIENCPQNTLQFLPKDLLIEVKNLKGVKMEIVNNTPQIIIDDLVFDEQQYKLLLDAITTHCKNNLTTKKMAQYLLNNQ
jgi:hypothetical protein